MRQKTSIYCHYTLAVAAVKVYDHNQLANISPIVTIHANENF